MQKKIQEVVFDKPTMLKVLRVAAYTRVSSGKDAMLHSLSQQISYYSSMIQSHEGWLYCGVYADEALTGTKDTRPNFQRLLNDCRAGKMDFIITKSISRFARNTVTLLQTVRELKAHGVGVYFEEQKLNTLTADGEVMLSILASYAQEESLSASENVKWRIRNDFKQGILPMSVQNIYGYSRTPDGGLVIVPAEAEVVRRIFNLYLEGYGCNKIAEILNENGIESNTHNGWTNKKVRYIITNEKYVGDLLLQKSFITDHLTKRSKDNKGELPQYYVADNHEPIITREIFEKVRAELERRQKKHTHFAVKETYPFTGKIQCGICGKNYRRKVTAAREIWMCSTFDKQGKKACASKSIPNETLTAVTSEVLGIDNITEEIFESTLEKIIVPSANQLIFVFQDGHTVEKVWKDRSRKESWTDEMREKARQKSFERWCK